MSKLILSVCGIRGSGKSMLIEAIRKTLPVQVGMTIQSQDGESAEVTFDIETLHNFMQKQPGITLSSNETGLRVKALDMARDCSTGCPDTPTLLASAEQILSWLRKPPTPL